MVRFVKMGRFEYDCCDVCVMEKREHINSAEWKSSGNCKKFGNRRLRKPRVMYVCRDHYRAGVNI